jgi:membrane-associated phospholipid phosphatase
MPAILNRVFLAMAAAIVLLDAGWVTLGHFAIDATNYGLLAVLVVPVIGAAVYYDKWRNEPALSGLLACTAFLIVFPAASALLSYLLVTITGPRIDETLRAVDVAMGFHWPDAMALAGDHPVATKFLALAYESVMPQTVVLMLVLGLRGQGAELYRLSLALALGAVITLAVWTIAPSFGAFSVYTLPDQVSQKLGLVLGFDYARDLVAMLKNGPGFISPTELRGLVGFPSYHTLQALVLAWYARKLVWLRWPALALNLLVLVSTPIQGGHHLIDMIGGAGVTVAAVLLAARIVAAAERRAAQGRSRVPLGALEAAE